MDKTRRAYCYKNLHKDKWSIRQAGKVVGHTSMLILSDAKLMVGKKGRERVLREKQKNVHAGISGFICEPSVVARRLFEITYNPYKYASFIRADNGEPVFYFALVLLSACGKVFACEQNS